MNLREYIAGLPPLAAHKVETWNELLGNRKVWESEICAQGYFAFGLADDVVRFEVDRRTTCLWFR